MKILLLLFVWLSYSSLAFAEKEILILSPSNFTGCGINIHTINENGAIVFQNVKTTIVSEDNHDYMKWVVDESIKEITAIVLECKEGR